VDNNFQSPLNWKAGEQFCCKDTIIFDSCQMIDRCSPNPCEHGGNCVQSSQEFECDCQETGYTGATCHMPLHPISCQAFRNTHPTSQRSEVTVDADGKNIDRVYRNCGKFFMHLSKK